jgi:hypothetical protein
MGLSRSLGLSRTLKSNVRAGRQIELMVFVLVIRAAATEANKAAERRKS